ncbi:MAG: transketolase [Candidatus Staskawiczbacteria bacterium]|nr:transketolase [Candidatus Staskawiczbacteria bacterium]
MTEQDYKVIAKEIRKKILKMIFVSKAPHIGSAFSSVDILTVLYFKTMNIDPKNALMAARDRFILSKGHAASVLYATLAQKGFFSEEVLDTYSLNAGKLTGELTNWTPGVEVSTGALGHGFPMGAGMAVAAKRDNTGNKIFVLSGDGECDEGSTWETAMFASHHKLDNLVGIIDYNKLQAFGRTNEVINLEPFADKWTAFGWAVREIDGHDYNQIESALASIPFVKDKPSMIIANTVKCKGISFMEDRLDSHYKPPTQEQYELALKEIEQA